MSEERTTVRFKLTRPQIVQLDRIGRDAGDASRNETARRLLVRVLEDDAAQHGEPIAVHNGESVD